MVRSLRTTRRRTSLSLSARTPRNQREEVLSCEPDHESVVTRRRSTGGTSSVVVTRPVLERSRCFPRVSSQRTNAAGVRLKPATPSRPSSGDVRRCFPRSSGSAPVRKKQHVETTQERSRGETSLKNVMKLLKHRSVAHAGVGKKPCTALGSGRHGERIFRDTKPFQAMKAGRESQEGRRKTRASPLFPPQHHETSGGSDADVSEAGIDEVGTASTTTACTGGERSTSIKNADAAQPSTTMEQVPDKLLPQVTRPKCRKNGLRNRLATTLQGSCDGGSGDSTTTSSSFIRASHSFTPQEVCGRAWKTQVYTASLKSLTGMTFGEMTRDADKQSKARGQGSHGKKTKYCRVGARSCPPLRKGDRRGKVIQSKGEVIPQLFHAPLVDILKATAPPPEFDRAPRLEKPESNPVFQRAGITAFSRELQKKLPVLYQDAYAPLNPRLWVPCKDVKRYLKTDGKTRVQKAVDFYDFEL